MNVWERMPDELLYRYLREDRHIYLEIAELISTVGPEIRSILEAACGTGALYEVLAPALRKESISYVGYDLTPKAIAMCRKLFADGRWARFEARDILIDQLAESDLVVAKDVLEHLGQWETALGRLLDSGRRFAVVALFNLVESRTSINRVEEGYCFNAIGRSEFESIIADRGYSVVQNRLHIELSEAAKQGMVDRAPHLAQYQEGYPAVYLCRRDGSTALRSPVAD